MRRVLGVLLGLALSLTTVAGPVAPASAGAAYSCGRADINRLIRAPGPGVTPTPKFEKAWANCQFRLYDDNDGETPDAPEIPHVFSSNEPFLAGNLAWLTRDELKSMGLSLEAGIRFLKAAEDRLFWGRSGGPLAEVPLVHTRYRVVHDTEGDGWLVINQRYFVFERGSLSPGTYKWRQEQRGWAGDPQVYVTTGTVVITDGSHDERANATSGSVSR
jgi:hypothetical protein